MTQAQVMAADTHGHLRRFLVDHAAGAQPYIRAKNGRWRDTLIRRGLVQYHPRGEATVRPRSTALTEMGRAVVCVILGEYADALSAASDFLEEIASPSIMASIEREIQAARLIKVNAS